MIDETEFEFVDDGSSLFSFITSYRSTRNVIHPLLEIGISFPELMSVLNPSLNPSVERCILDELKSGKVSLRLYESIIAAIAVILERRRARR